GPDVCRDRGEGGELPGRGVCRLRRPGRRGALIDRELYLPEKWTDDRGRCRAAGIGDGVAFATKPRLPWTMIACSREAGVPFSWVAGDEVYGGNPGLSSRLEKSGIPYVMAQQPIGLV